MTVFMLVLTVLFMNGATLGIRSTVRAIGYEDRLFDTAKVHTVAIVMNDWNDMIENAASEEYYTATVVIDGESYKNVGIRTKGNTSLSTVASLGSERYSFKIEFDHYDDTKSYHGLDKLCLNNLIQDSTMMKDYLTYTLMNRFGVKSPLCSYAYITVNGEEWGLYLAVEGVEEAFLERNYGSDYGNLYKPESTQSGGNRGGMNSSAVKLQYIDDTVESYADIWDNAKTDIDKSDQTRLIESLRKLSYNDEIESIVDLEQIIRYFVVHNYVCNGDSYTGSMVHNYYLYEKDGKLSMIPWDYNLAFGTFGGGNANTVVNTPIDNPVENASNNDRPLWNAIAANADYIEQYHRYFSEFLGDINISEIIDGAYEQIEAYVKKDPTAFYTYEEFTVGVNTLRQFCTLRSESISAQLQNEKTDVTTAYADASSLNLSDMGTMSMGGNDNGKGGAPHEQRNRRENFDAFSEREPSEFNEPIETGEQIEPENEIPAPFSESVNREEQSTDNGRENDRGRFDNRFGEAENPNGGNAPPTDIPFRDGTAEEQPFDFTDNRQMPPDNRSNENGVRDFYESEHNKGESPNGARSPIRPESLPWIYIGVSAAVLAVGILVAKKFRA